MKMLRKRAFIIILFIAAAHMTLSAQETAAADKPSVNSTPGDYSTSVFMRYNLTRPDYAKTPYFLGMDLGLDMDFGGSIPVVNLSGLEISGKYIYLNSKNEISDDRSESHYFSTGISLYMKTRLEKPVNFGVRAGTGSGWMIAGEVNEETDNNKRLNGIYLEAGLFGDFDVSERFYIQTGFDIRRQHYFKSNSDSDGGSIEIDPVDMGFIYIKAGFKL